jgi:hypothetical protein
MTKDITVKIACLSPSSEEGTDGLYDITGLTNLGISSGPLWFSKILSRCSSRQWKGCPSRGHSRAFWSCSCAGNSACEGGQPWDRSVALPQRCPNSWKVWPRCQSGYYVRLTRSHHPHRILSYCDVNCSYAQKNVDAPFEVTSKGLRYVVAGQSDADSSAVASSARIASFLLRIETATNTPVILQRADHELQDTSCGTLVRVLSSLHAARSDHSLICI